MHVKRHDAKQAFTVSTKQDTVETMAGQSVNAKQLCKHFNAVYTLARQDCRTPSIAFTSQISRGQGVAKPVMYWVRVADTLGRSTTNGATSHLFRIGGVELPSASLGNPCIVPSSGPLVATPKQGSQNPVWEYQ